MFKWIVLAVILIVVWKLLQRSGSGRGERRGMRPGVSVRMRACARCGVHVPENEALHVAGRYYCCVQHRDDDA